jgi:cytochrome b6-f complex iron-sulfur subunit
MADSNQPNNPGPPSAGTPPPSTAVTAGTQPPAPTASPTAVSAAPPRPAPPVKPAPPPAKPAAKKADRRFFLTAILGSWFAIAWAAFVASMIGLTLGTLRFLFPNVLSEPPSTFRAGHTSNYEENRVDDKFKEQGAWVIRSKDERGRDIIYALSTTCTHLGCTPNWLEAEKKFKCPCHGSGFKISGVNFEGPAPRPLERYAIRRTEEGEIVVDKSRKFQRELGQWDDSESYILL